uniref:right-handed parallel beta-helix repeat-containing protein n=1 Tax=Psychromonas sp. TaxID=1884585 RepID=UPI003563440F
VTGSGERTAESYNGESQNAALLVVEYTTELPVYQCADGIDNDGDGAIDMADQGCISSSDSSEYGNNECDDGIDNDGDGLTDVADLGCINLAGLDETNCGDGICGAGESWQSCSLDCAVPQCSDGIDNDADGLVDFPNDSGCLSEVDDDEADFLGNTLRVPTDYSTIQAAINAAQDGDMVLVYPGTYPGDLIVSKRITIASNFINTENQQDITNTIISGGNDGFFVQTPIGEPMKIIGFTITGTVDGIDFEGGSSIVKNNIFEYNTDDAIDLDGSSESIIENNIIRNNGDDGLEIRLHNYNGPTLNIIVRNNTISGNGEDGIQLIDYPGISDRVFYFYNNIIKDNVYVGLGLMDNGDTTEDYRAASIPEPIYLYNNHFIGNSYGITGGDNLKAMNNMVIGTPNIAFKNVDGNSQISYSLFWNNSVDNSGSNLDTLNNVNENPLLDINLRLQSGSPAINAGVSIIEVESDFDGTLRPQGAAYDIGAFEYSESISP